MGIRELILVNEASGNRICYKTRQFIGKALLVHKQNVCRVENYAIFLIFRNPYSEPALFFRSCAVQGELTSRSNYNEEGFRSDCSGNVSLVGYLSIL